MNQAICFLLLVTAPIIVIARSDLPHFDPQTTRVAFIENGDAPLSYTTGVVDAKSFWKQYGGGVGTNVGGIVGTTISSQSSAAALRHRTVPIARWSRFLEKTNWRPRSMVP
jgi:hypothetical protein